jgi:predicted RNA-binding Zn ribbon-like protein
MKSRTSFDLNAGSSVLNFINTVEERPGYDSSAPLPPVELLDSSDRLLAWCEASEIISRPVITRLRREWRSEPRSGRAYLKRLVALREGLFSIFWGMLRRGSLKEHDLDFLNAQLTKLPPKLVTKDEDGRITLTWPDSLDGAQLLVAAIVEDAARLLTSDQLPRVRVCAAKDCGWLFLDTSKSGRRRWCDMADCGNREKQRRFQVNERGA